jgi:uncharacterized membrane protein
MSRRKQKQLRTSVTPTAPTANKPDSPAREAMAPGRLRLIQGCLVVALAVSAYLAFVSATGGKAVGCGPDSGCDQILRSRWATWFNIPVSYFALAIDAVFLFATTRLRGPDATVVFNAWRLVIASALMVAGAAVWFIVLQLLVVKSICPYCMAAHGAGLVAACLALHLVLTRPSVVPIPAGVAGGSMPRAWKGLAGLAVLGLIVLIAGQLVYQPKTFQVQEIARGPASSPTTSSASNSSDRTDRTDQPKATHPPNPIAATPSGLLRAFSVYDGQFVIDVGAVPTLGAYTNAQVMVALHDYTCHHCRDMHPLLAAAQRVFSNQLVVVSLPMPFDPRCNPIMQRPNPKHTNACDYAMLSLAVWRADPSKHHAYDEYLFTGPTAPPVQEASMRAAQLVGNAALAQALRDPWVEQHVRLGVSLYEVAYRSGQGSMPQFLIGQKVAVGTLPMANLMGLLASELNLVTTVAP